MPKVIEAVYENGVLKPLEKVNLKEGEKVRLKINKRMLNFEPIELRKPLSLDDIKKLKDETWTCY